MKRRILIVYEWKIKVADNYRELEKLVEQIQAEGWTIEKIDVKSISVVAYKAKKARPDLIVEDQPRMSGTMLDEIRYTKRDEGRIEPDAEDWDRGDYGQQEI
jgi:hypothetical protein